VRTFRSVKEDWANNAARHEPLSAHSESESFRSVRIILVACGAALAFGAFAQQPPAPIWPADGKIPESLKDNYVFLTPDPARWSSPSDRKKDGRSARLCG
jgi:hypothetical protein